MQAPLALTAGDGSEMPVEKRSALDRLSSEELGVELAEAGISVKPAYCFTDDVTEENDYFRVGFGEDVFPLALEAFTKFVEERKAAWLKGLN